MKTTFNSKEFEKSKIYEKLDYLPEPKDYKGQIPWKVQQQIAATNGIHYRSAVGKLKKFPIPKIPLPEVKNNELLLDIGNGWGRWLVGAGKKGYIPVGIDLRLEFCETAREVLYLNGLNGYTVVADLGELPFKEGVFDAVWSFSVIQHTHKTRFISCANHIYRILKKNGYCFLEFPSKTGLWNRSGPARKSAKEKDDYNSWCVRYYSIADYKGIFLNLFKNFSFRNHSFFGIGVLENDLDYVAGLKNKLIVITSLFFSKVATVIKPLKYLSDSIYIKSIKKEGLETQKAVDTFKQLHLKDPKNNLNIVSLLRCPISGDELILDSTREKLISTAAKVFFPVVNNIPILVKTEAVSI
ncbi:MAG: methyltransferase domain-containing protein [Segetibacter sp.]